VLDKHWQLFFRSKGDPCPIPRPSLALFASKELPMLVSKLSAKIAESAYYYLHKSISKHTINGAINLTNLVLELK
jgi:hypothetical protein